MSLINNLPRFLCLLLLFGAIVAPPSRAAHEFVERKSAGHKFYASLAQADLNSETNSIEVSLRLFTDDLEVALTRRAGRAVYLDRPAEAAPLVLAYLRERFELKTADGRVRELAWVGMEPRVDATWIYFEIRDVGDLTGASLRNRVFFEQFDEQTNTVNVRHGERHVSLVFRNGDEFKTIFNP